MSTTEKDVCIEKAKALLLEVKKRLGQTYNIKPGGGSALENINELKRLIAETEAATIEYEAGQKKKKP